MTEPPTCDAVELGAGGVKEVLNTSCINASFLPFKGEVALPIGVTTMHAQRIFVTSEESSDCGECC